MKTTISGGKTHTLKNAASERGRTAKAKTQKFNNHSSSSTLAEKF
jgi:hypothetical protein